MIDNPYWPMVPGTRWEYREADTHSNEQTVIVKVKQRTKDITGISATVVRDTVTEDGELVEDTFDWYAQDVCGNVWYLGENTKSTRTASSSRQRARGSTGSAARWPA